MTINTVSGILSLLLGLFYTANTWALPRPSVGNPLGPILFPIILGIGMTILGIILLIQEQLQLKNNTTAPKKTVSFKIGMYGKFVSAVTVFSVLYVLLFERLGYVLSTFLFLGAVLLLFNGFSKWKLSLLISLCFSLGVYILFGSVLSIQLPRMPILGI